MNYVRDSVRARRDAVQGASRSSRTNHWGSPEILALWTVLATPLLLTESITGPEHETDKDD